MKKDGYPQAIGTVATFTLLFLLIYAFNLTKSPVLLMLCATASLGYTLVLLGFYEKKPILRSSIYIIIGIILILVSVSLSITTPHDTSIFF